MENPITDDNIDYERIAYEVELEFRWRKSRPQLTEKQWLDIFPQGRGALMRRLRADLQWWRLEKEKLNNELEIFLNIAADEPPSNQWVKDLYNELWDRNVANCEKQIKRLHWQLNTFRPKQADKPDDGRITPDDIEAARAVPIEELLPEPPRRRHGDTIIARCPFHNDKNPSFNISIKKNLWHCFPESIGGDSIAFVMKQQDVDFLQAVRWLVKK